MLNLLKNREFYKLVCGAGNEDVEAVKKLVYIYAKAGWKIFDISARAEILDAAKEGIKLSGAENAHICVSIGIKGDPHISKAGVNNSLCISCGNCARNCPNDAIYPPNLIDEKKCIGCGICEKKCPASAIKMYEKDINVQEILPILVKNGVDILELHIMGHDRADLEKKWQIINDCNVPFASICIDRDNFGNKEALSRINKMIEKRAPYTTIIQADGIPMSGSDDSYKTTLQAVAMGEIMQNANLPVFIVLSGGTNSKTAKLCELCDIYPHGIAIGSWARKIIKQFTSLPDFWDNIEAQNNSINLARKLLEDNKLS